MPEANRDELRADRLRAALPTFTVRVFARLRSTQQKAIEDIEAGRLAAPALIVAARQTAGRGQRTNRWWSDAGSLCATAVLPAANLPPGQIPLRVGLAIAEVVAWHAPRADVRVKWPNDVLVNGLKIAGVLCERRGGFDLVGIGINVRVDLRRLPPNVRRRATSLHACSKRPPARGALLAAAIRSILSELNRTDLSDAFAQRNAWHGRDLTAIADGKAVVGRCAGIDDEGRLLIRTADGLVRITDSEQVRPA